MTRGRPKKKAAERKRNQIVIRLDDATIAALRKAGRPSTVARLAVEDRYKPR